ncbi:helix-turn-helix domain-containing protein [Ancylobacter pratisalsi]|nr:helix-turn-helix transcriptional regulator [Ancylobacter pratisalsi]
MTALARRLRLAARLATFRLSPADLDVLCAASRIDRRIWRNAAAGRPVGADAHMAICHAVGVTPVSISTPPGIAPRGPVCWASLGAGLRMVREGRGHSARRCAAIAGVSLATVSRCENGHCLSFDSLARLAAYIGRLPQDYTAPAAPRPLGSLQAETAGVTGNTRCNTLISRGDFDDADK